MNGLRRLTMAVGTLIERRSDAYKKPEVIADLAKNIM